MAKKKSTKKTTKKKATATSRKTSAKAADKTTKKRSVFINEGIKNLQDNGSKIFAGNKKLLGATSLLKAAGVIKNLKESKKTIRHYNQLLHQPNPWSRPSTRPRGGSGKAAQEAWL